MKRSLTMRVLYAMIKREVYEARNRETGAGRRLHDIRVASGIHGTWIPDGDISIYLWRTRELLWKITQYSFLRLHFGFLFRSLIVYLLFPPFRRRQFFLYLFYTRAGKYYLLA